MKLCTQVLEQMAGSLDSASNSRPGFERRQEPRTRFSGHALIVRCTKGTNRKPLPVSIRDLSAHGIGITSSEPLKVGERFILILPRDMAQVARAVLCTVVNSRPSSTAGCDVGATFTALIRLDESAKPAPGPAATASLPVDKVISSFHANLKDAPSREDLAAIESIAHRGGQATAPAAPTGSVPAGADPSKPPPNSSAAAPPAAPAARASGQITPLLTRELCISRAEQALGARTLSGVVAQVISLAASPRSDLSEVASLVARDPMLSARILQAANSASYTSTRGIVSTIPEAVRNIGCATVRNIAATLGVFDAMPASEADGFNPIRCWQHSFGVATLCQRLAPETDSGLAYLVGLCHDLGEILFHTHFGSEYRQVLEAQSASGKSRGELERVMLGMSHNELAMTILRCMALPDSIRKPIDEFHAVGMSGRTLTNPLARALRLAEFYANGVMLASSGQSPLSPLSRPECRAAAGSDEPERPDGPSLRGEILALTAMLARLSVKDEAELMAPLYPASRSRVLLVRDPSLSTFDPIEAALECLCEVAVRPSLPAREEVAELAGAVVVARSTSAAGFTAAEIAKSLGDAVPVLWLAGRIDSGPAPANPPPFPTPTPCPVSISRLAEFVQSLNVSS